METIEPEKQFELHEQLDSHDWASGSPVSLSVKICVKCGAMRERGEVVQPEDGMRIHHMSRKEFKNHVGTEAYKLAEDLYGGLEFEVERGRKMFIKQVVRTFAFGLVAALIVALAVVIIKHVPAIFFNYLLVALLGVVIVGALGFFARMITGDLEKSI